MSLSSILPAPTNHIWDREDERSSNAELSSAPSMGALVSAKVAAPPYGQRKGWIPRCDADFGDGGAFPEIVVAQYPLGMGAPGQAASKSNALAVQLDINGKVKYDAIARQGHGKDKIVYSSINQLLPAEVLSEDAESTRRPDDETIADITEKTRLALEKLTNQKISASLPVRHAEKLAPAQYIRYTPSQQVTLSIRAPSSASYAWWRHKSIRWNRPSSRSTKRFRAVLRRHRPQFCIRRRAK